MATSNPIQNSMTDEYIRDLLECPVCMETIDSVPVYKCANGHAICKVCIEKLNKCPICRNDSAPVRSLKLETIVQKLKGIQPENVKPITAKSKWGKGSVGSYGTINGSNQVTSTNLIHQSNPREATPRQASPRQARRESWIVINNQGTPQVEIIICNQDCSNSCRFIFTCLILLCLFIQLLYFIFFQNRKTHW